MSEPRSLKQRVRDLLTNAKIAMWRRHQYRRLLDIPRDFLLRSASDPFNPRPSSPLRMPLSLKPRSIDHPVYLRLANSDFVVFGEIFDGGEYAAIEQWNLPADARIIDLGANIGLASVYFSSRLPQASIVAVEPDGNNCRMIARNCQGLLRDNRMRIVRAFGAADDGIAGIDRHRSSWAFTKVDQVDAAHEAVPCVSMPSLLAQSGFAQVDLLKCDIEGTEREMFADCAAWIGRVKHLVVETHRPYCLTNLYEDLRKNGWEFEIASERQEDYAGIAFLRAIVRPAQ